jgi:hypothetical protein
LTALHPFAFKTKGHRHAPDEETLTTNGGFQNVKETFDIEKTLAYG